MTPPSPDVHAPADGLIGLDWGTSSLRAFRLDAHGAVQEVRHRPWGLMNLPAAPADAGSAGSQPPREAAFRHALEEVCGDWLQAAPRRPVLACGMVGSAQGWREAPYLETPASLDALGRALIRVEGPRGIPVHIVPGLIQRGALPNVMRGEETQVLGVLAGHPLPDGATALIGLPGSHSKWATAQSQGVLGFHTFMTGEVFAALRQHTLLGRTMAVPETPDDAAFVRGLAVADSPDGALGLLSHIFSTRTLGLVGELSATAQFDYLSGLLIGHEVACLARQRALSGAPAPAALVLCGEPELCRRYALALASAGLGTAEIAPQATAVGLWRIAQAAGLTASR